MITLLHVFLRMQRYLLIYFCTYYGWIPVTKFQINHCDVYRPHRPDGGWGCLNEHPVRQGWVRLVMWGSAWARQWGREGARAARQEHVQHNSCLTPCSPHHNPANTNQSLKSWKKKKRIPDLDIAMDVYFLFRLSCVWCNITVDLFWC